MASARIAAKLSRWNEALGEYRILLAEEPRNVQFWIEYGQVAESAGRPVVAREAYGEASRLSPKNPRDSGGHPGSR